MNEGQTNHWDNLSRKQQLIVLISDTYKDLHGSRPRYIPFHEWSEESLENYLRGLERDLNVELRREEEEEAMHQEICKRVMGKQPWSIGDIIGEEIPV
jgi:hypothetical protein